VSASDNIAIGNQIGQVLEGMLMRMSVPKSSRTDPEAEFAARLAMEKSETLEYIIEQETNDIREQLDRLTAEVAKARGQSLKKPVAFTFAVTKTDGGLMRKVVAKSGKRTIEFTIDRTPDGFPSSVSAMEKT
jgi:hypothetical protein